MTTRLSSPRLLLIFEDMDKTTHTEDQFVNEFRKLMYEKYRINIDKGNMRKQYLVARRSYTSGEKVEDLVSKIGEMFHLLERR